MRAEVIYFMDMVSGSQKDDFGDPAVTNQVSYGVYAEIKSISQSEFYQAQTSGQKPEMKFIITDYLDYQGQKYLIHEGVRYRILRTHRTVRNEMEITCYGGVRDADATVSDPYHQKRD